MNDNIEKNIKRASLLSLLWKIQNESGFISDEDIKKVSVSLEIPESEVYGVVTFYGMLTRRKLGKNLICLCSNICCWLRGSGDILNYLKARLGIGPGETTKDGLFTLFTVECLGACGGAPMMMVNGEYFENLDYNKIDDIINGLKCRS